MPGPTGSGPAGWVGMAMQRRHPRRVRTALHLLPSRRWTTPAVALSALTISYRDLASNWRSEVVQRLPENPQEPPLRSLAKIHCAARTDLGTSGQPCILHVLPLRSIALQGPTCGLCRFPRASLVACSACLEPPQGFPGNHPTCSIA